MTRASQSSIDPKRDGGPGYRDYYDENNGWTYAWQVQHDIDGLVGLLGGRKATEEQLDQLFREPLGLPKNRFYVDGANATGLVGQFAMGNETAFHIPYLYNYVGAPWKTQKRVRFLLDVWFKDNIFGIPGDEDGGGMSAFVVFSSIGLYPVTPGQPHYAITSPVFERTTISLPNGKTFAIVARGASASASTSAGLSTASRSMRPSSRTTTSCQAARSNSSWPTCRTASGAARRWRRSEAHDLKAYQRAHKAIKNATVCIICVVMRQPPE